MPIIRRNNSVYVTLGTFMYCYCVCIPDSHPHRITSAKCRINTVVSPDDGHIVARNMYRLINILRINIIRINFATSWLYLQVYKVNFTFTFTFTFTLQFRFINTQ